MVKITITKGKWKNEVGIKTIFCEVCPNPDCPTQELEYPNYLIEPNCPDCKTPLMGKEVAEGYGKRINYHLRESWQSSV